MGQEKGRGRHKGRWCDFGGHVEKGETAAQAAAREFSEESLCVVNFVDSLVQPFHHTYCTQVQKALASYKYDLKVSVVSSAAERIRGNNQRVLCKSKLLWTRTFQSASDVPEKFCWKRREPNISLPFPFHMRNHPAISIDKTLATVNSHFLEKIGVRWWSLEKIKSVISSWGLCLEIKKGFARAFYPC